MMKMNLQLFASAGVTKALGNALDEQLKKKAQAEAVEKTKTASTPTYQVSPLAQNAGTLKGVDSGLINKINTPFSTSAAYTEAMNYTNELLRKISEGKTSYTDQIKNLMGEIQNRPKFEYDVNSDPLFQQALASAMGSGKTAMQDTIGQASALTGGYGSTYATTAGNQQYNAFIEDAYNNLPEYYQMAMQAYQMEGEELYNQLGMLNTADATEFQRMYDAWGANFSNTQQMYQNEYQKWSDEVSNAFNLASMQNSDWWNTTNFNESQRQHKADMDYKYAALAQEQAQFNSKYDLNGDGVVNYLDSQIEKGMNGSGADDTKKEPSPSQYSEILRILNNEGEDAMYKYVDTLGADIDVDAINKHINDYGRGNVSGRTFTIVSPAASARYAGKINHGVIRDQYGNDYTLEEIAAIDKNAANKLRNLKKGQKVTID